jgi:phage terminase large subunit
MIERSIIISAAGDEKRAHINGVFVERMHDRGQSTAVCIHRWQSLNKLSIYSPGRRFLAEKGYWFLRKD